jgi:hypothetical protein
MTLSGGVCSCKDTHATFNTVDSLCECNSGYFEDASNVCTACTAPCSSCSTSATECTACDDSTHMTLSGGICSCTDPNAAFNTVDKVCACDPVFFEDPSNVCTACTAPCDSC